LGGLLDAAVAAWHMPIGSTDFVLVPGGACHHGAQPWATLSHSCSVDQVRRFDPSDPNESAEWAAPRDRRALMSFLDQYGAAEAMVIPVATRQQQLGLLVAARRAGSPAFSHHDEIVASFVAGCAALALDRSRLRRQLDQPEAEPGSPAHDPLGMLNLLTDAVVTTDLSGTVVGWNHSATRLYGIAENQALGSPIRDLLPTKPIGATTMRSIRDRVHNAGTWHGDFEQVTPDGRQLRVTATSTLLAADHRHPRSIVTIIRDDTEVLESLRRHEALSTSMLDALPAPTVLVDAGGRIEAVNRAWRHKVLVRGGSDAACGVGSNYLEVCSTAAQSGDELAAETLDGLSAVLRGELPTFSLEYECAGNDVAWFSMRVYPVSGGGAVVSHHDITQDRRAAEALARAATVDDLTGLPNRHSVARRLERQLAMADDGRGDRTGVMFVDIARFRVINDSLGHDTGDEVLRQLAQRLGEAIGDGDHLARIGGDVFIVVARRSSRGQFADLAARISSTIARPLLIGERKLELMTSMGTALASPGCDTESVLAVADDALHKSKARGAGRLTIIDVAESQARVTLDAELELRAAISGGQLELEYQAVVDTHRRTIDGFEALVRWNHPARGRLGPAAFITLAEDTGLIVPLGAWVLDTAISTASTWEPHQTIAVNLSPLQIAETGLVGMVGDLLARHRFDPRRLILEVTESSLVSDDREMIEPLEHLRELGVRIAIDDFGTGYSSFSYLRRLPVDTLKIDKSFIDDLPGAGEPIVSAIIGLATALGLDVIAEGVERDEQLDALDRLGCRHIQGFLFHRPAPAADLCPELASASCNDTCPRIGTDLCTEKELQQRRPTRAHL